jgi:hypothetical protein
MIDLQPMNGKVHVQTKPITGVNPTENYEGTSTRYAQSIAYYQHGKPWFTYYDIPLMQRDSWVRFLAKLWCSPFAQLTFEIKATSPEVGEYVKDFVERFRAKSMPSLLRSYFFWGYAPGGIEWHQRGGQAGRLGVWKMRKVRRIFPQDAQPLVYTGTKKFAGFRTGSTGRVESPYAFWFAGHQECGTYYDEPPISGAYDDWKEYVSRGGARHMHQLYMRKHAVQPAQLYFPPGTTNVTQKDGRTVEDVANLTLALATLETYESGGNVVIETRFDPETKQRMWELVPAKPNPDAASVKEYPEWLKKGMAAGVGIPIEVVQAAETGMGWSGRQVPMLAWYAGCDELSGLIFDALDNQAIRQGVRQNFGAKADYEIKVNSLVEAAKKSDDGQQQPPGGGQPQPAAQADLGAEGPPAAPQPDDMPANGWESAFNMSGPANFDAAKHPRANDGKFGHGGGPAAGSSPTGPKPRPQPTKPAPPANPRTAHLKGPIPANQKDILHHIAGQAYKNRVNDAMGAGEGVKSSVLAIPHHVGSQFDAHGTTDVHSLANLLNGGIDPQRPFFSEPLRGGQGLLKDSSAFMVLSHPGKTLKSGGIGGVAVDGHHHDLIPHLQKAFPGVVFVKHSDLPNALHKVVGGQNHGRPAYMSAIAGDGHGYTFRDPVTKSFHFMGDLFRRAEAGVDAFAEKRGRLARMLAAAAMAQLQEEAHAAGDPHKYQDHYDALADLAADPQELFDMAGGHTPPAASGWSVQMGWIAGTSRTGRPMATNDQTGRKVYGERALRATAAHERRQRTTAALGRAAHLTSRVMHGEHTIDDLTELADHLPALPLENLRYARAKMAASFGGKRKRDDMVNALVAHVKGLHEETLNPKPEEPTPEPKENKGWFKKGEGGRGGVQVRENGTPAAPKEEHVYTVDPKSLHVDPQRFQYKVSGIGAGGVTDELKGTKTWNPKLGGTILVWRDPADGKDYVVNGHHRHELATRTGAEKMNARWIDAKDYTHARAQGALANIAEGRGTSTDAAKYMRDTGDTPDDLQSYGVSLSGKVAADALSLRDLSDKAFRDLTAGKLNETTAAIVGKHLKDHGAQDLLFKKLETRADEGKDWTQKELETAAKKMARAGKITEKTTNLFGDFEDEKSTFDQEVELESHVSRALNQKVNDFAAVANEKRADRVADAGNTLAVAENQKRREQAAGHVEDFTRGVEYKGAISEAIKEHAADLAAAKTRKEKDAVKQRTLEAVGKLLESGGADKPSAHAGTAEGTGRENAATVANVESTDSTDRPDDAGSKITGLKEPWQMTQDEYANHDIEHGNDTEANKTWFNGSHVAEQDGSPSIVYHGSPSKLSEFKIGDKQRAPDPFSPHGVWFADSEKEANKYGEHVHAVQLAIKNPYHFYPEKELDWDEKRGTLKYNLKPQDVRGLKDAGHDGVIFHPASDKLDESLDLGGEFSKPQYMIFDPSNARIVPNGKYKEDDHKEHVENAIRRGLKVPDHVLSDYPEFTNKPTPAITDTMKPEEPKSKPEAAALHPADAKPAAINLEPHRATLAQFVKARQPGAKPGEQRYEATRKLHKSHIDDAIASGKPVPPEALADHTDATKASPPAADPGAGKSIDESQLSPKPPEEPAEGDTARPKMRSTSNTQADIFGNVKPVPKTAKAGQQLTFEESVKALRDQKAEEWAAGQGKKITARKLGDRFQTEDGQWYQVGAADDGHPISPIEGVGDSYKAGKSKPSVLTGTYYTGADKDYGTTFKDNTYATSDFDVAHKYGAGKSGVKPHVRKVQIDADKVLNIDGEDDLAAVEKASGIKRHPRSQFVFDELDRPEVRDALIKSGHHAAQFKDIEPGSGDKTHHAIIVFDGKRMTHVGNADDEVNEKESRANEEESRRAAFDRQQAQWEKEREDKNAREAKEKADAIADKKPWELTGDDLFKAIRATGELPPLADAEAIRWGSPEATTKWQAWLKTKSDTKAALPEGTAKKEPTFVIPLPAAAKAAPEGDHAATVEGLRRLYEDAITVTDKELEDGLKAVDTLPANKLKSVADALDVGEKYKAMKGENNKRIMLKQVIRDRRGMYYRADF